MTLAKQNARMTLAEKKNAAYETRLRAVINQKISELETIVAEKQELLAEQQTLLTVYQKLLQEEK
jgi:hypothetical protein